MSDVPARRWLRTQLALPDLHPEDRFVLGFAEFAARAAQGAHDCGVSIALAQAVLDLAMADGGMPGGRQVRDALPRLVGPFAPEHLKSMRCFATTRGTPAQGRVVAARAAIVAPVTRASESEPSGLAA